MQAEPLRRGMRWPNRRQWASLAALVLLAAAAALLVHRARAIDWPAVGEALLHTPKLTLVATLLVAAASHVFIAAYDVLAARWLRLRIPWWQVWAMGLIAYPLTLNLGALVGGVGFRWKLYGERGVRTLDVGRIVVFTACANWIGYGVLAGAVLLAGAVNLPPPVALPASQQQVLGVVLLVAGAAYVLACARSPWRRLEWRGHAFELPSGPYALAQIGLSAVHWSLMAATAWILMPSGVHYLPVLATLLAAAVASVLLHIPGGLGVIEGVFVTMLGGQVPEGPLVAAVLAFRAAFYLLPLTGAGLLYLALRLARRGRQ
jgi:uncharacterized membrane protein YbhN (UPF0104 family)